MRQMQQGWLLKNRTSEDLKCLQEALVNHEKALVLYHKGEISAEVMMEYDGAIHLGIAASAHNNFMLQIIEAIRHVTIEKDFFLRNSIQFDRQHFCRNLKRCTERL